LAKQETSAEFKKAIEVEGDFKRVALDPRVPDKAVCIDIEMSPQDKRSSCNSLIRIVMFYVVHFRPSGCK
jgi:hypothetical protein